MYYYDTSKVYLDVKSKSHMSDNELILLNLSGLGDYANVEIWTACGTNNQMSYSTHGSFRYFGKFPPPIATYLISNYTSENDVVLDPMCGSGTTGVEALHLNRHCILNDVSPLSVLLAKVKTTFLPEDKLRGYIDFIVSNYKPLSMTDYPFEPNYLSNYNHWFLLETLDSLRGIKYLIEQIEEPLVKDFFNVCFAGTIRRVSRATTQQGRLFLDIQTAEKDAVPFFLKRVETAIVGVSSLPKNTVEIKITSNDLRDITNSDGQICADLVICHPPYFNSYKYSSINSLELAWLGFDYAKLRRKEVREFFKVGKEENAVHYIDDMVKAIMNLHSCLKKNSVLALMIGDTIIKGNYIPVTKQILSRVSDYFNIELVALRSPKYTEAAWVASQRRNSNKIGVTLYDFVVILRRK
jgi:DNA modification methylase